MQPEDLIVEFDGKIGAGDHPEFAISTAAK
jgi:hypothetical protein